MSYRLNFNDKSGFLIVHHDVWNLIDRILPDCKLVHQNNETTSQDSIYETTFCNMEEFLAYFDCCLLCRKAINGANSAISLRSTKKFNDISILKMSLQSLLFNILNDKRINLSDCVYVLSLAKDRSDLQSVCQLVFGQIFEEFCALNDKALQEFKIWLHPDDYLRLMLAVKTYRKKITSRFHHDYRVEMGGCKLDENCTSKVIQCFKCKDTICRKCGSFKRSNDDGRSLVSKDDPSRYFPNVGVICSKCDRFSKLPTQLDPFCSWCSAVLEWKECTIDQFQTSNIGSVQQSVVKRSTIFNPLKKCTNCEMLEVNCGCFPLAKINGYFDCSICSICTYKKTTCHCKLVKVNGEYWNAFMNAFAY